MHTEAYKKPWKIGLHGLFQSVILQNADVHFFWLQLSGFLDLGDYMNGLSQRFQPNHCTDDSAQHQLAGLV